MSINTLVEEQKNNNQLDNLSFNDIGDDHLFTGLETPMKPVLFDANGDDFKDLLVVSG